MAITMPRVLLVVLSLVDESDSLDVDAAADAAVKIQSSTRFDAAEHK